MSDALVRFGVPAVVVFLMTLVGLRLEPADFRRVAERPWLVAATLAAQTIALPAIAGGFGWLLGAPPTPWLALVLIAACPAGVLSNVYTAIARGNVALSVTLTALGTVLAAATLPVVMAVVLAVMPDPAASHVRAPVGRMLADLLATVVLPVGAGMTLRGVMARAPRLERGLQRAGALATVALVSALLTTQWGVVTETIWTVGLAIVPFTALALALGDRVAHGFGSLAPDRAAVALEFPGRNLGVAAIIGAHSLGRPEIAGVATAVFVVQVPLLIVASVLLRSFRPAALSR